MLHLVVTSVCVISGFHVVLGVISVIVGIIQSIKSEVWLAHCVSPIWSGGFFIITGILGIFCARRKTSYVDPDVNDNDVNRLSFDAAIVDENDSRADIEIHVISDPEIPYQREDGFYRGHCDNSSFEDGVAVENTSKDSTKKTSASKVTFADTSENDLSFPKIDSQELKRSFRKGLPESMRVQIYSVIDNDDDKMTSPRPDF